MSATYYQVVGRNPCMIDYPTGDSIAHRPGQIFEAHSTNASVQRAVRAGRLRELSEREAGALRNAEAVKVKLKLGTHSSQQAKPKAEPPKPAEPIKLNKSSKAQ
jgi:hypothetical protein